MASSRAGIWLRSVLNSIRNPVYRSHISLQFRPTVHELEEHESPSVGVPPLPPRPATRSLLAEQPALVQPAPAVAAPAAVQTPALLAPVAQVRSEVVFIDSAVPDYQSLLASVPPGIDARVLDPARDGVKQLAEALEGRTGITAVHLVSHGGPGRIQFGGTELTLENLGDYVHELRAIGLAMADQADLLVYGCDVAAGDEGAAFVARLGAVMGADVAASTTLTGSAALGGDWRLEAATGPIEAQIALSGPELTQYQHLLGFADGWGANYANQATVPPEAQSGVVVVAAGESHSLALKSNGTVVGWGENGQGQASPPAGLTEVMAVAAGGFHSLALRSTGTVVGWGNNDYGQAVPPAGLSRVVAVAAGEFHSLALKGDGTVVAWGYNFYGQAVPPAGLTGVVAIAAGEYHSLALRSDGTVVGWGNNDSGQINVPAGLTGVVAVAAGFYHSLALKSDGTVVGWGSNSWEQASPPAGLTGVVAIAAGAEHSLALKSDGSVVAWGWNGYGQGSVPGGLPAVAAISAGADHNLVLEGNSAPSLAVHAVALTNYSNGVPSNPGDLISAILPSPAVIDPDMGTREPPKAIAVIGVDNTHGSWQYSLDGGTTWRNFSPVTGGVVGLSTASVLLGPDARVRFAPSGSSSWGGSANFTFRAWDRSGGSPGMTVNTASFNGGSSWFSPDTGTASITILANRPPVAPVNSFSTNEDTPYNGQIAAYDPDGDPLTYALKDFPIGTVSVAPNGAFLYSPKPNYNGGDAFTYTVSDGRGGTTSGLVTITVNAVNDAPVLGNTTPTLPAILEDDTANTGIDLANFVSSLMITDVDPSAPKGIAVTGVDNTNGAWQYSTDSGANWTDFGSPSETTARLLAAASANRVRFVPAPDYNGTAAFTFRAWDQSAGDNGGTGNASINAGTTAFSGASGTATLFVNPVNDAPVLITPAAPPLPPISEDDTTNTGISLDTFVGLLNITDPDGPSAPKGIAVTKVNTIDGTWQFSTDSGLHWTPFGSPSETEARLLAASSTNRIRFVPNPDFNGPATFLVRAWDQSAGMNGGTADASVHGGTTAFSDGSTTGGVLVFAVNDAPVLTPQAPSLGTTDADLPPTPIPVSSFIAAGTGTPAVASGITDVDAGAVRGIAVTGASGLVRWEYSVNGGADWLSLGATSPEQALLLRDTDLVRYIPDGVSAEISPLFYVAWDQTSGTPGSAVDLAVVGQGGRSAFSTQSDTASLTVYDNSPHARFTPSPNPAAPNQEITFDASESYQGRPDRQIVSYAWDFGDGGTAMGVTVTHAFAMFGKYPVTLTVTDDNNPARTDVLVMVEDVSLGNLAPVAKPGGPYAVEVGQGVTFDGSGSLDPNAPVGDKIVSYAWDLDGDNLFDDATGPAVALDWSGILALHPTAAPGMSFAVALRVADTFGVTGDAQTSLEIQAVTPVLTPIGGQSFFEHTTLNFTAQASNLPLDEVTFSLSGQPAGASIDADTGAFAWTPSPAQLPGDYSVTVRVSNVADPAKFDEEKVAITLVGVNDPPTVNPVDPVSMLEDGTEVVTLTGISPGPGDESGQKLTITVTSDNQAVVPDGGLTLEYTPGASTATLKIQPKTNATGDATIRVLIQDDGGTDHGGNDSRLMSFPVHVTAVNDAPVLDSTIVNLPAILEDPTTNPGIDLTTLVDRLNITDPDGPAALKGIAVTYVDNTNGVWQYSTDSGASWTAFGSPSETTARLLAAIASNRIRFVPDPNSNGLSDFTFRAWDQSAGSDGGTANASSHGGTTAFSDAYGIGRITVTAVNDAPTATTANLTVPEDSAVVIDLRTLVSDVETSPDQLTFTVSGAAHGSVTLDAYGHIARFAPDANYNGPASFQYTVKDKGDGSSPPITVGPVTITVDVTPVADVPVVVQPIAPVTVDEDAPARTIDLSGVFGDADIPYGDKLTLSVTGNSNPALVAPTLSGSSLYLSFAPNQNGVATVTVRATDLEGHYVESSLQVTVNPVNDPPVVFAPIADVAVNEDAPEQVIELAGVFYDPDVATNGDVLALSVSGNTNEGLVTAAVGGDGKLHLAFAKDQNGSATITVRATDTESVSAETSFKVTVEALNDAPVAQTVSLSTPEDTAVAVNLWDLVSDVETPKAELVFAVSGAAHGTVVLDADGHTARFTPDASYNGDASFQYSVTDKGDGTSPALTAGPVTITVTVSAVNNAPVLGGVPAEATIPEGQVYSFTATASDIDTPASGLRFSLEGAPAGAAIDPATGVFTWAPTEAQGPGNYSFTVALTDGQSTDRRQVTLHVGEVNRGPSLDNVPREVTIAELQPYSFTATASDPDVPANALTFSLLGAPDGATIDPATGVFAWTPTEAQGPGDYAFTVRVSDGKATADRQVTLHVKEVVMAWATDGRGVVVTGTDLGSPPLVRVFDPTSGELKFAFMPYDPGFKGGVNMAVGDVNGDGVFDIITGAGPGGGPHVKVFDGVTGKEVGNFFAYDAAFRGGTFVAVGDVNGDGKAEIITGAGPGGGPHVKVFRADGSLLSEFMAYDPAFTGGVTVAAADLNGDGVAEIVTGAGPGGGPHVRTFRMDGTALGGFMAYDPALAGGVFVAAEDFNGDGKAEIVTGAGAGGGPHVKVFDGQTFAELQGFFAYDAAFIGGVRVGSSGPVAGGKSKIVTGPGPGGGPHIRVWSGLTADELAGFLSEEPGYAGGVYVGG